jgi:anaerobic selenocysteine-containing dehydrogenase
MVDDWEIFWGLAKRLDLQLTYDGVPLDMSKRPTTDSLLAIVARHAPVSFEELKSYELGKIFDEKPQFVEAADPGHPGRFTVMPEDVAAEMHQVAAETHRCQPYLDDGKTFTHLLTSRRVREVQNSAYRNLPITRARMPYNYAYLHPDEIALLQIHVGDKILISSATDSIQAVVAADPTVRTGVISMTHGWGGLPDETIYERDGSNTGLLISTDRDLEPINAMPRMSAIPVNIAAWRDATEVSAPLREAEPSV